MEDFAKNMYKDSMVLEVPSLACVVYYAMSSDKERV